jgi:hypothetical protein
MNIFHAQVPSEFENVSRIAQRVDERKANVLRIAGEAQRAHSARFAPGTCVGSARREFAQKGNATLTHNAIGIVRIGAKNAANPSLIIRHGAIRKRVIRFFAIAVTFHDQHQRFVICAFVAPQC